MADLLSSFASYIFTEYLDKLLEAIIKAELDFQNYMIQVLSALEYVSSMISIDWAMAYSLAKGFICGNLVIFAMCYLD
jgi:hypothetical protein